MDKTEVAVEVAGSHWQSHSVAIAGLTSEIEALMAEHCSWKEKTLMESSVPLQQDAAVRKIVLAFVGHTLEDFAD